jgi:hypothetical protein
VCCSFVDFWTSFHVFTIVCLLVFFFLLAFFFFFLPFFIYFHFFFVCVVLGRSFHFGRRRMETPKIGNKNNKCILKRQKKIRQIIL